MTKRLLYLNGLAILGTIMNHTLAWGFIAMFLWTHRYQPVTVPNFDQVGSPSYYILRFFGQLILFTIPAFIFTSGYFVAFATGRNRFTLPWKIVFSRILYLVIPYLFWSGIVIFGRLLEGKSLDPYTTLVEVLTGNIAGPYYFVPLLIQLYLLSPLLVPLARKRWKLLLIVTGLIQLFAQFFLYPLVFDIKLPFLPQGYWIHNTYFPNRIFWFALGLVVGFHLNDIKLWLVRVKWRMLVLTIAFFIAGYIERELIFQTTHYLNFVETIIDSLYALCFILVMLGFENITMPLTKQIDMLGSNTLGIYLVHVPAQEYPARIIYHLAPWMLGQPLLFLPIIFISGLGIPLLLMEIVKRSPLSRYYKYIFG